MGIGIGLGKGMRVTRAMENAVYAAAGRAQRRDIKQIADNRAGNNAGRPQQRTITLSHVPRLPQPSTHPSARAAPSDSPRRR